MQAKLSSIQRILQIGTFGIVLFSLASCSGDNKSEPVPKAPDINAQDVKPTVAEPPKEKPLYVYSGDRFRDPFVPAGESSNYQPDAIFDPQRAILKGIVFGKEFRSAVLSVGGSGTFFIKKSQIFDVMGKTVEGYKAKIYVDKVVLEGEADNIYELKIRTTEEGEKNL